MIEKKEYKIKKSSKKRRKDKEKAASINNRLYASLSLYLL
jgi:hypothetical protein